LPQKIVQPHTAEEIGRLLACCNTRFYWGSRNRAMILMLLDTGMRRTELVNLDLADLDLEGQRLRILHGEGTSSGWCGSELRPGRRWRTTLGCSGKPGNGHPVLTDTRPPAIARRYTTTYGVEKAAQAHALFSPAGRLDGRLHDGGAGPRDLR